MRSFGYFSLRSIPVAVVGLPVEVIYFRSNIFPETDEFNAIDSVVAVANDKILRKTNIFSKPGLNCN